MRRGSAIAVTLVLISAAAYINYSLLTEAYGSGPPYYGRTTNMDKWSNPLPVLGGVDLVVVAMSVLILVWGLRRRA